MDVVINYIMDTFNVDVEWARNKVSDMQKRIGYGESVEDVLSACDIPKVFSRYFV